MITEKLQCRICGSSDLVEYLNLGKIPVADNFTNRPVLDLKFELAINLCQSCNWSQLSHLLDPIFMYQVDYPYDSRVTETGKTHWHEFANSIKSRYELVDGAHCLDIGSNTGALLSEFKHLNLSVLGVDPSQVACSEAKKFGIDTICNFFEEISEMVISDFALEEKFSLITATNCFAHVDNLRSWTQLVSRFLKPQGVLVLEVPHILELIKKREFDTVYHEHLSYCSVTPLISFFNNMGLQIIHVEKRSIHGGTVRIHIAKTGIYPVEKSVEEILNQENSNSLDTPSTYLKFGDQIRVYRETFRKFLESYSGLKFGIVSAPAKGVTFFHYMGLDDYPIIAISDKSNMKIGKFFPGTMHKVISDADLALLEPDVLLILAWNFAEEISESFKSLLNHEVEFMTAIPEIAII
jgi:SAM-dependent methyltransferase